MGINPTQANFKSFTFDGKNSRGYGVYITGQGVFNAPERNVEMIEIPNRNGAYALDKGNFNNIEVTYPAGIFADTETDFAEAVSDLRNFLCSRVGYVRLEDDYNPNEYRLAIYKSGLEVDHDLLIAGEFELVFECKPQRFLKSGETLRTITSGDTITNNTWFDAKPLLLVNGYGTIGINDAEIVVADVPFGDIKLSGDGNVGGWGSFTRSYSTTKLNAGDDITSGYSLEITYKGNPTSYSAQISNITSETNCTAYVSGTSLIESTIKIDVADLVADYLTGGSNTFSVQYDVKVYHRSTSTLESTTTCTVSGGMTNNGHGSITYSVTHSPAPSIQYVKIVSRRILPGIHAYSTKSSLGNPMYIDLEIGECWNSDYGSPVSVNDAVQLPSELPVLPHGETTITFDNTFTSVRMRPRWWKV